MTALPTAKPNMQALARACEQLGISYTAIDEYGDFLAVHINGRAEYFVNTRTPFNSESVGCLCRNKVYAYMLLKDELPMPETRSYIDPKVENSLRKYVTYNTVREIVADITATFSMPVILKMNAGSQGRHVYLCKTSRRVRSSIKAIFNRRQQNYDFSVLAQPYIAIAHEYRVLVLDGEIVLLYEKVATEKNQNLSPLHNESGKAVLVTDTETREAITKLITGSPTVRQMRWLGLDVAQDEQGKWWVIELNTHPGFSYFIRDNGIDALVPMYVAMLQKLQNDVC